ncbi:MAG: LPS-assembly protein LptD [Candidatus Rokubacteria bacterium]|nr:LPS-assembly protein LptD [Candidatus Rokubacteria bacterium]
MQPMRLRLPLASTLLTLAAALLLTAPGPLLAQQSPLTLAGDGGEISILADSIQQVGGTTNLLIAVGNVEITRGATRLLADRVELDRDTGEAVAQGKVVFYDGEDRLVGERIDYNLRTGTGVVYHGSAFSAPYYSLSGERLDRVGEGVYEVRQGVFTTCEGDEPAWSVRVGSATADLNDFISGRDASFWVGKVPLIPWIPYFAAAIRRERQSGFLFPRLGISSTKGVFAKIPYFWAIGDSQDATLTLDAYAKRGVGLEGEYRYLLSEQARGVARAFYIHEALRDTQGRKDTRNGEDRESFSLRHDWQIAPRMALKVDANVVSDDFVLREYGDRLHERTSQRTETTVSLSQRWEAWSLVGAVLWYQDLTTTRPVELQRVPEVRLRGHRQPVPGVPGLLYEVESSFTEFVRVVGPEGPRLDLHPRLFLPVPVAGLLTLTPFAGGRATYYDQRVIGQRNARVGGFPVEEAVREDRVRRQVEGGVEAETRASRVYALGGAGGLAAVQHLVEPRATWLEIRGEDQKALPLYDTDIDRVGKVSQVTYSLTNRVNGKTVAGPNQEAVRWEMARLVVSQTYNLLPGAAEPFKDLRADVLLKPSEHFGLRGEAAWNVYGLGMRTAGVGATGSYRDVSAEVGTRFDEITGYHTVDGGVAGRLTRHLAARAATSWDVNQGVAVEHRFGLDLSWQCWAIALEYVARHQNEDELRFSVNLLGLGQVGARAGTSLR